MHGVVVISDLRRARVRPPRAPLGLLAAGARGRAAGAPRPPTPMCPPSFNVCVCVCSLTHKTQPVVVVPKQVCTRH